MEVIHTNRPRPLRLFPKILLALLVCSPYAGADTETAASIELRCGGQGASTKQVVDCLDAAVAETDAEIQKAQLELMATLRRIQPHYPTLKKLTLQQTGNNLNRTTESWTQYRRDSCRFYQELHKAIGEDHLEKVSCELRMTKDRLSELREETAFWFEKFPVPSDRHENPTSLERRNEIQDKN